MRIVADELQHVITSEIRRERRIENGCTRQRRRASRRLRAEAPGRRRRVAVSIRARATQLHGLTDDRVLIPTRDGSGRVVAEFVRADIDSRAEDAYKAVAALIRRQVQRIAAGVDRGTADRERVRTRRSAVEGERSELRIDSDRVARAADRDAARRADRLDQRVRRAGRERRNDDRGRSDVCRHRAIREDRRYNVERRWRRIAGGRRSRRAGGHPHTAGAIGRRGIAADRGVVDRSRDVAVQVDATAVLVRDIAGYGGVGEHEDGRGPRLLQIGERRADRHAAAEVRRIARDFGAQDRDRLRIDVHSAARVVEAGNGWIRRLDVVVDDPRIRNHDGSSGQVDVDRAGPAFQIDRLHPVAAEQAVGDRRRG